MEVQPKYDFSHVSTSESEPIKQIQICLSQSHSLPFEDCRFDDDQDFWLRLMWYSLCQIMIDCTQWRLSTLEETNSEMKLCRQRQCGCCTGWISLGVGRSEVGPYSVGPVHCWHYMRRLKNSRMSHCSANIMNMDRSCDYLIRGLISLNTYPWTISFYTGLSYNRHIRIR